MSRSFIAGGVAGLALSVVVLGSVSLMSPPVVHDVDAMLGAGAGGTDLASADTDKTPEPAPTAETADDQTAAAQPATTESATETASADPVAATPPPATPPAVADPAAPAAEIIDEPAGTEFTKPKDDGTAAVPAAEPAPATAGAAVAEAPSGEADPNLTEKTAAAAPEDVSKAPASTAAADAPEAAPVVVAAAEDAAPVTQTPQVIAPNAEGGTAASDTPPTKPTDEDPSDALPPEPIESGEQVAPAPAAEVTPEAVPADPPAAAPEPAVEPQPSEPPAPVESAKPRVVTLVPPPAADGTAEAAAPAPSGSSGVKILRLPQVAPAEEAAPANGSADQPTDAATAQPAVIPTQQGPLDLYAARWRNPDAKPVMAIVLFDMGVEKGGLDPQALASLPFATTIAIDPMLPDATDREMAYRTAGAEVAMLVGDFAEGSTDSDLEVAYQSYVQTLPESVALISTPDASSLRSSLEAQHIAALLSADGRGLLTYDLGLNASRRAAEKAGVPVALVAKTFDQNTDNSGALSRALDRAAFTAAQDGSIVVALPTTPEAITALMAWASGPTAASVSIAPASAVLLANKAKP